MFASLLALAAPVAIPPQPLLRREVPLFRERPGPTPFENRTLSQPHRNSDNRMFPDIAIRDMRVDGDTLYVQLVNQGRRAAQVPILLAARAQVGGMKTDLAQVRTGKLLSGELRWVPIKGFSVQTASTAAPVFALANVTAVSAVARLAPSTTTGLDRSGQGCGECALDGDERNNVLTLAGDTLKRGRPSGGAGFR